MLERFDLREIERIAAKVKAGECLTPEEDAQALVFIDTVQRDLIPAVLSVWKGIHDTMQAWFDVMTPAIKDLCEQMEAAAKRTGNDSNRDAATREPG